MNFTQAVKAMLAGKKVRFEGLVLFMDNGCIYEDEGGDPIDIDNELVDGSFQLVEEVPSLREGEVYATFNPEKNRWVSTTEPAKNKARGQRVAVFALAQEF